MRFGILVFLLSLVPADSAAQVDNPDFASGLQHWTVAGSVEYAPGGGNPGGYAYFATLPEDASGWIQQRVDFRSDVGLDCHLSFDLAAFDESPGAGFDSPKTGYTSILTYVEGELVYSLFVFAESGGYAELPWHTVEVTVPCGSSMVLRFTVVTDAAGHGGCNVGIDNVRAHVAVATEHTSWGRIKALY